jgi:hypothetical protein
MKLKFSLRITACTIFPFPSPCLTASSAVCLFYPTTVQPLRPWLLQSDTPAALSQQCAFVTPGSYKI